MVLVSYWNCNICSLNGYNFWNILFLDVNFCIFGCYNCDWCFLYCKIIGEYLYFCFCRKGYIGVLGSCIGIIVRMNMYVMYGK